MRLFIEVPQPAFEALRDLALSECRSPQEQARYFVVRALQARRLLAPGKAVAEPKPTEESTL